MKNCFKAAFFDVGGTLLSPYPSVGHIYSRVARRHGVHRSAADLNARFKKAFFAHKTRRRLINKVWWKTVVREAFAGSEFRHWNVFFEEVSREFEKKSCWRVSPGGLKAVLSYRKQGVRLAVVSNWDSRLPALLRKMGLARYFERQFISYKIGAAKPDPRIFRAALRSMKLKPSEVIHIGNDWKEDVLGARSVGIKGVLKSWR